jgi:hypothetical protein
MSYFENFAELRIREAIENGEFDHLEGFGKPLDHGDYFNAPPELRAAYHILRNAGAVPEEVILLNSIHQITGHIKSSLSADEKERLIRERTLLRTQLDILKEHRILMK